ncbi:MAG: efflux RND transporter periplasmic adaptor subunit [Bryobacteraceae bacterium]|nr:efflux RND transporter periplasmic adaptor subunit [Bryobacteraceae bacterium]
MKIDFRRVGFILAGLALAGAGTLGIMKLRTAQAATNLPTASARKGDFTAFIRCRGELKARRSVQVTAPKNVPELRIVWLATQGAPVKEGDLLVRFDPSSAKQQLQDRDAALKQAQAALDQAVANGNVTAEQDKLELAAAQYQVEKAKLEASKAEIVSRLQGEESRVDLGLAEKKLEVQQAGVVLNRASNEAKVASLRRLRDKAKDELELTTYRLGQMELRSPGSGVVHFLPNNSQGWMNAKPFKVGDQAWPGGVLAEIPDLNTLEMEGKVEEIDRGRMELSQEVRVRIDSLPETKFPGRLVQLSPMTVMGWEWPPSRTFRGFARIDHPDKSLRPAMNGSMDVVVARIPNSISVPSKSVFTQNGKPVVYVAGKDGYRSVPIEVLARNPDEVAVKGIAENTQVALTEPESKGKS